MKPASSSHEIIANRLAIQRGDLVLANEVSFSLSAGQILHVQGENGAGKSTLLLMLAGILPIQQGEGTWGQKSPVGWPTVFIGHKTALNIHLCVLDNLHYLVQLQQPQDGRQALSSNQNISEIMADALVWAGLTGYEYEQVGRLSAGQQRRAQLARLYVDIMCVENHSKRLWLLDEPMTALDVSFSNTLQQLMLKFTELGGRIICTSHQPFNHEILPKIVPLTLTDTMYEANVSSTVMQADHARVGSE